MKTAGSILKEARLAKGISLQEAGALLKIHIKFLEALEEGSFSKFANPVQLRGFLINYCDFLQVNKSEVLAFFRREYNEEKERKNNNLYYKKQNFNFFHITPKSFSAGVVVVAIIAFVLYVFLQYRSFAKAPQLVVESPASDLTVSNSTLSVFGKVGEEVDLNLNGQKIIPEQTNNFALTVSLSNGLNVLNFTATNKLNKSTTITRKVIAYFDEANKTPEDKKEDGSSEKPQTEKTGISLLIDIYKDASYLAVYEDGKKSFDGIALNGVKISFVAEDEIKVKAGNAGGVKVTKDGNYIGVMGKEGEVVETVYTK